jgi:hypothetical protein
MYDPQLDRALFLNAMPCNPNPFLRGLVEGLTERGTRWLRTNEAKRILWIVMAQAYGQLAVIDLTKEWDRLHADFKTTHPDENEEAV